MNQKFAEYIKSHIREYLPQEYQEANVTLERVAKGNDRMLTGLLIRNEGESFSPAIYLEPYAGEFESGRPMDDIMREIAQIKMENSREHPFDVPKMNDYEAVRSMLAIRLCDPEKNQEYLKDKPYSPCGELAAAYRIQITENSSIAVTDSLLNIWGISLEQLHQDAVEAENARNPVCLYDMEDLIYGSELSDEPDNLFQQTEPLDVGQVSLYVLTNQSKINGAGVIAQDGVLDKVGELIGSDFYVLPSSVHEVLITPDDGNMQVKELEVMVRDVNAAQVAPEDLLSDKVQFYDRAAKTLGRKQEKGVLERLADNKTQIQKAVENPPKERHTARQEASL